MKLKKIAALVPLISFFILSLVLAVFPAVVAMPVNAQASEEVLYKEDFNDDEAQGWHLDEGWYVGGNTLFVDDANNYAWARYTGEIQSANYSGMIFNFLLIRLQGEVKANVRLSDSSCYAVSFTHPGENFLSLRLLKLFSTNGFLTYTYTPLAERTIDYDPESPYLVEIITEAERLRVFIRQPGPEPVEISPVIDYIESDPIPPGNFAFEAHSETQVEIDDIIVVGYNQPAPPPEFEAPDLTIPYAEYWFEDDGRALVFYVEIANQGNAEAAETMVSIRDQSGGLPGGEAGIPALPAGELAESEVWLEVPEEQQGTMHIFSVEVDPEGHIEELNEDNNRQGFDVQIPEWGGGTDDGEGWPWHWAILILLVGGIAGYSVKKLMDKPKVQVKLQKDMGTQEITRDVPAYSDFEILLRSVPDAGRQDIETEGNLITGEREGGNE